MKTIQGEFSWEAQGGGSDGPFRVARLADDAGEDLTALVGAETRFDSLEALRQALLSALGEDVMLIEANSMR